MIRRLMTLITAVLIAWLGLLAFQPVAAALPAHAEPTYAYDGHRLHSAASAHPITERGPPTAYADAQAHVAVDLWSHGILARRDGLGSRFNVTDATTNLAALRMTTTTGMTSGHAEVVDGASRVLQRFHVAAKTGTVWDDVAGTASAIPGTGGPKSFELTAGNSRV